MSLTVPDAIAESVARLRLDAAKFQDYAHYWARRDNAPWAAESAQRASVRREAADLIEQALLAGAATSAPSEGDTTPEEA